MIKPITSSTMTITRSVIFPPPEERAKGITHPRCGGRR
jgi:hypothetical protein